MIKYKELRWSNCFSYGVDNKLRFDQADITQLVGKNGHGKSSVGLILEEILYNKNSKGIKKANILNRYGGAKTYHIALDLERDGQEYTIETTRGSTQKVTLTRDGVDISSHTATSTFKDIEALIGYDHKTFSQIVYQSSTQSLEFLTATDTQRKKFLIDLLSLGRYAVALEVVKTEASAVSKQLAVTEGKINQSTAWLAKFAKEDLNKQEILAVPVYPDDLEVELGQLNQLIYSADSDNKKRIKNTGYSSALQQVEIIPAPTEQISADMVDGVKAEITIAKTQISNSRSIIAKLRATKDKCPTCGSPLGVDHARIEDTISSEQTSIAEHTQTLSKLEVKLADYQRLVTQAQRAAASVAEYEKYHALYDATIPRELVDAAVLTQQANKITAALQAAKQAIAQANSANAKSSAHNARVELLLSQKQDMQTERDTYAEVQTAQAKRAGNLAVLSKAFSTTGLVAYKIECLVKDLEAITNEYLAEMSDGRFQLGFEISSSDKLNVVITDNGTDVEIAALSSGERARVNIATLLAIRKLMQSLSNTRSNLLILDETVENLDAEGKEKLIEVLLAEQDVNTFLISHGFSHPLLEKLHVVKTNNISRIES